MQSSVDTMVHGLQIQTKLKSSIRNILKSYLVEHGLHEELERQSRIGHGYQEIPTIVSQNLCSILICALSMTLKAINNAAQTLVRLNPMDKAGVTTMKIDSARGIHKITQLLQRP